MPLRRGVVPGRPGHEGRAGGGRSDSAGGLLPGADVRTNEKLFELIDGELGYESRAILHDLLATA